jgi:multiple sugar transport system substrate-binding protein
MQFKNRFMVAVLLIALLGPFALSASGQREAVEASQTVTIFVGGGKSQEQGFLDLIAAFEEETGIEVEMNVIPASGSEFQTQMDLQLLGGDSTDVLDFTNPVAAARAVSAGFLMPIDEALEDQGFDPEPVFGRYLQRFDDRLYYLPYSSTAWLVFYNKAIFDAAGVPYPEAPWTWDDYVDTARQLTDIENDIWGSYMLDYDAYRYLAANQMGVDGYKADGSSNYDHPAFREALEFYKGLGENERIQPSYVEFVSRQLPWNWYALSGQAGMTFIGNWYFRLLNDQTEYPRDWDYGVVATPAYGPRGNSNIGAGGSVGVNANAANPEGGARLVRFMAENNYRFVSEFPAREDLSAEEIEGFLGGLAAASNGSVTAEEIRLAIFDNGMGMRPEKILGALPDQYRNIIMQESELYFVGEQTVDVTVERIETRMNQALRDEGLID